MKIKWGKIWDVIFPRHCAICDEVTKGGRLLCNDCMTKIKVIKGATCRKCGKPVEDDKIYCRDCNTKPHCFDRGYAVFRYQDIKESLYRFKYEKRAEYAEFYAKVAYEKYKDVFKIIGADAFIPVPLHYIRKQKRGYNQAQEFGKYLSKLTGIPMKTNLVIRKKNTIPMKKLSQKERQNNLKKAFIIRKNDVKLKTIIILDDIYTTGATIDNVSLVLKDAGVQNIYFLTIAIGNVL